jgi:ABC-type nitrate/sulfonate/bicarbonate transport system permease component
MSIAVEQPTPELDPAATPNSAQQELITEIADNDNSGIGAFGWTVRLAKMLLSAVISIAAVAAFWQLFLTLTKVDPFIGRGPADVFEYVFIGPEAAANRAVLIDASIITVRDAFLGLIVGLVVAMVAATTFNLLRSVEQTVMPMAMVLQSVPLVAMTPIIALMFGRGLLTAVLITAIVTFFPALVNINLALRGAPAQTMDLMRAYGANQWTTLYKVQFPSALPAVFASLRIAAPLAVVGAMLAEWLATSEGLGYLMLQSGVSYNMNQLWAAGALITFFSVVLYQVVSAIESSVLTRYAPEHTATNL